VTAAGSQAWRASAACAGLGPSLFFSEHPTDIAAAKQLCSRCVVADECAAAARRNREPLGVWGGEEYGDRCAPTTAGVGISDQRLVELFASASPRSRAIDVLHRVDVSTASAYRYLARAIQLGLVERRGRSLYPAPRR
jgi:Transcription factor WhiB